MPTVLAAVGFGPTLVVVPEHDAVLLLATRLRRAGLSVAVAPDEWPGAAGGVGAATARRFAEAGATLVLGDLNAVALEDLCGQLAALAEVHGVACDVTSVADIENLTWKPRIVNVKPSRIGGLEDLFAAYAYCEREGIGAYGGGQTELSVGRDQIQYLAAMMHPDTPNDVAPSGYNETNVPAGLPTSPLELLPRSSGFGLQD